VTSTAAHAVESGRKAFHRYDYRRCADQDARSPVRRPVVVVGAGPVGLAASIDLGLRGVPVVLIDTRLVLILANHIGDLDVLRQAIALAKGAT